MFAVSFSALKILKVSSWFVIFEIDFIYPMLIVLCEDCKGFKKFMLLKIRESLFKKKKKIGE
jgi:hypothetical protein